MARSSLTSASCLRFFKEPTLKLTPAGENTAAKRKYLTDMARAVIKYDKDRKRYTSASLACASGIARHRTAQLAL
jgi:hypothetical protein